MKDLSLVTFTLLSQMAVGAFWVLLGLRVWAEGRAGTEAAAALTDGALLLVGPVMVVGILSSFFHLGLPFRGWRALNNLRGSWLSREVLCALLFAAGALLYTALQWLDWGPAVVRSALAGAAALLGLALLASMTNAYRLRTVPAWDRWTTPAAFLIAACLLGGLAVGMTLGASSGAPSELLQAARHLDWAAKLLYLVDLRDREGLDFAHPAARLADHDFGNTDPERGAFWQLWEAGRVDPLCSPDDAEAYLSDGPEEGRGWGRGRLIRRFYADVDSVNWGYVELVRSGDPWSKRLRIDIGFVVRVRHYVHFIVGACMREIRSPSALSHNVTRLRRQARPQA